ncbi:MAG: fibronectin type III domain-containing protein, partial [Acutalibacteraceae bacterium]
EPNVTCYYQIYTNVTSSSNPTKGQAVYKSPVKCTQKYAGYHTVYLPQPVELNAGEYFSVVITYENKGGKVMVMSDMPGYADDSKTIYNYATSLKGQSFLSEDGKTWEDLYNTEVGANLRIKAFTKTRSEKPQKITLSKSSLSIVIGQSSKLTASITPYYAVNKFTWSSSNPDIVSVDSNGTIKANKYGTATVTCTSTADKTVYASAKINVILANVTGLNVSKSTQTYVKISWSQHADADYYEVYLLDSKTGKKVLAGTTKKTYYVIRNLTPGQDITCYTVAVKGSGSSIIKSGYGTKLLTSSRPKPVSKVKAKSITPTTAKLYWGKAQGADEYYVYVLNTKTGKYSYLNKTSSTSLTVTKLKANTTYTFAVTSKAVFGSSRVNASSYPTVKIKTSPANVSKFTAKKAGTGKVTLTWSKSSGASGYQIYRYDSKTKKYVAVKTVKTNTLTVSKLTAGQTYKFRIRSYGSYGDTKLYSGYTYVSIKL